MKKLIFAIFILAACNTSTEKTESKDEDTTSEKPGADPAPKPSPQTECYMHVSGRDSFFVELNRVGDELNGFLEFRNYQKDKSRGTVRGRVDGDVYKLIYDFFSEGTQSIMEVYFKKENDILLRGVGDMSMRRDTLFFNNPSSIDYDVKQAFAKSECGMIRK